MSKKLFLAVLPFLALAMASCSRGNGGAGSSSKAPESSEPASSEESSEGSEDSSDSSDSSEEPQTESAHTYTLGTGDAVKLYVVEDYDGSDEWGGIAKFVSGPIDVTAGDSILVTANPDEGEPVNVYKNAYDKQNNVNGSEPTAYTVRSTAEDAIITLYQYESGWAFSLTGYQQAVGQYNISLGNWLEGSAVIFCHPFDGDAQALGDFIIDGDTFELPTGTTGFVLVRMPGGSTAINWDTKWNQSDDLAPGEGTLTFKGWSGGSYGNSQFAWE